MFGVTNVYLFFFVSSLKKAFNMMHSRNIHTHAYNVSSRHQISNPLQLWAASLSILKLCHAWCQTELDLLNLLLSKKEWPCCNCGLPYSNFSLVIFCLCFFLFYIATQILHGKPFSTQYFFLTDSDYGSSHYWEVLFENSCF